MVDEASSPVRMRHGTGATDCLDMTRVNPLLSFHKQRISAHNSGGQEILSFHLSCSRKRCCGKLHKLENPSKKFDYISPEG
jgi:hypothetical protein